MTTNGSALRALARPLADAGLRRVTVSLDSLDDAVFGAILILVMVFKALALVISLGSGTSGGLLAPMFMSSAAMGGAFALGLNYGLGTHLAPGAFALVAMGAVFGAAARATFTFIIFAFELTRDYNAILPLMLVCVIADGVALVLMRNSIMTEKLARRGVHIHLEYEPDVLQQVHVADVMDQRLSPIPSTMKVTDLAGYVTRGDEAYMRHQAFPIVDGGRLAGLSNSHGDTLVYAYNSQGRVTTITDA